MDIGDGGDAAGFLANADIDLTSGEYYGLNDDERGAYLYDSTDNHAITKVYAIDDWIDILLSAGNGDGTQGVAKVYVKITRIGK